MLSERKWLRDLQSHTERESPEPQLPLACRFVEPAPAASVWRFHKVQRVVEPLCDMIRLVWQKNTAKLHLPNQLAECPSNETIPRRQPGRDVDVDVAPLFGQEGRGEGR